jgi:hypothetical protein
VSRRAASRAVSPGDQMLSLDTSDFLQRALFASGDFDPISAK